MAGLDDRQFGEATRPLDEDLARADPAEVHTLGLAGDVTPVVPRWSRAIRAASISASSALHIGLAALVMLWLGPPSGLIKEPSDALSVEMVHTDISEQHTAEDISELVEVPAPSVTAGDPNALAELKPVEMNEAAAESAPAAEADPLIADEGIEAIKGSEAVEEAIGAEKREVDTPRPESEEERKSDKSATEEPAPKKTSSTQQREPEDPQTKPKKGVAAPNDSAGAKAKAPRVSASTGSVLNYASRVRAKVAGHVPRAGAGKGTVVVSFAVTASGSMSSARISKSSGNPAVDRSVLAGVRAAAPFPPPPPGASPSQLRFSVAFQFH